MAIKKIAMAVCDICGKMEKAEEECRYYDSEYFKKPDGWFEGYVSDITICPECGKKLGLII